MKRGREKEEKRKEDEMEIKRQVKEIRVEKKKEM